MIVNADFQNKNTNRAFPLDEGCSLIDDAGSRIANNLLADGRVMFVGDGTQRRLFLSSIYIGPEVVSLTIGKVNATVVVPDPDPVPPSFQIIAALTAQKPIIPWKPYPVAPVDYSVGGWLVFGPGINAIETARAWRFSDARNSLFVPSIAVCLPSNPVTGLGKEGVSKLLKGLVELAGGTDVEVLVGTRFIDMIERRCIIIRLKADLSAGQSRAYLGSCAGSPTANTCARTPIYRINDVEPDCEGNINITIAGAEKRTITNDKGIVLQTATDIDEMCDALGIPPEP